MPAEESLREGNIEECLAQLQEQVRRDPSNPKHRVFLFQLLAVLGEWERALTQLNVLGDLDVSSLAMVQMYREALRCEALREQVFAGQRSPVVFGEPDSWIALLLEALRLTAEGRGAESQGLRDRAFEEAPATSGAIDGQAFEWVADADARLGPIMEAIVNGKYFWVPFHRIREVVIDAPADLRDVVWMPAHFAWANGGETVGLIPTRYPGSASRDDNRIKLARKTEWLDQNGGMHLGVGQRMLATDAGEYPLMDVRVIRLSAPDEEDRASRPEIAGESAT